MERLSPRLGLEGQFLSAPTSLVAAFGAPPDQRTYLLRVEPGEVDLARLTDLEELIARVSGGWLGVEAALEQVTAIERQAPRYPAWLTLACFAIAPACAARFFGGGWREVAVAGTIGLGVALLHGVTRGMPAAERLFEPAAALLAALLAGAAAAWIGYVSPFVASVAGLIVLLPGLSLTTALTELATRNLVSGTSRLAGVTMTFLGIGGGLALGAALGARLWDVGPNPAAVPLPAWTEWAALAIAPLALAVLFRAPFREAGWVLAAGVLAYLAARAGTRAWGPEIGTFAGATVAGIAANVYARSLGRVAEVALVPSIILLIPGSIGLRSISSLIAQDVVTGVALAFTLVLVALALAAGVLFANVAVSPRRGVTR
jgi:uncharacterized membrane protein YjjP (DUF1212 family)